MAKDIYRRLAEHLSTLGMAWAAPEDLVELLKANFTPKEAAVALALPTKVAPLQPVSVDDITQKVNFPRQELENILEGLLQRNLLFSGKTKDGKKGYALHQRGFGFPQAFFWKGEETPELRNMAVLIGKSLSRKVVPHGIESIETKPFRFVPVGESITQEIQAVYPYDLMEKVIEKARVIAVAHCPCRVMARLRGEGCNHPTEVCMKYDEMAEYLIERGLGRRITKEEALQIIRKSEEAGLVHFVDNAMGDIKHNCNCCGCVCLWVSKIRKRLAPRDALMATYYVRYTDVENCNSCGNCAQVCPVEAVSIKDELPVVDEKWCIGCGVCVRQCPTSAAKMRRVTERVPQRDFRKLHQQILDEKGLK